MTILGFVGVGRMGSRMVKNLGKRNKVCIYDISPHNTFEFRTNPNITICNSIEDFTCVDKTFLMLPTGECVQDICLRENGLFSVLPKNARIYDCSTIASATSVFLGAKAKAKQIHYLDSPVSGGTLYILS
jgi:3-hydroxyisobutyrate dehydrogenase